MSFGVAFESVLLAAQAGAPWAWKAIYGEIAGPVTGFFRARGLSDPESAAGDVFFELSRNVDRISHNEANFSTLVFAIAYRRLLDEQHHPKRSDRAALADRVLDQIQSEIGEVVDEATIISQDLREAFQVLEPKQRDVLSLRVVAGLTVEQTAYVLGATIETVRSTQRKAVSQIRGALPPSVVAQ